MRAGARLKRLGTGSLQDDDIELQRVGEKDAEARNGDAFFFFTFFPDPSFAGFFLGRGGAGGGGAAWKKKREKSQEKIMTSARADRTTRRKQ